MYGSNKVPRLSVTWVNLPTKNEGKKIICVRSRQVTTSTKCTDKKSEEGRDLTEKKKRCSQLNENILAIHDLFHCNHLPLFMVTK